jgi:hypothetical protein
MSPAWSAWSSLERSERKHHEVVSRLECSSCALETAAMVKEAVASSADRVSRQYQLVEVFSVVQSLPPFRMEGFVIVASALVVFVWLHSRVALVEWAKAIFDEAAGLLVQYSSGLQVTKKVHLLRSGRVARILVVGCWGRPASLLMLERASSQAS